jgi:hypothetical protein
VRGVAVFGATTDVGVLWKENAAFAPYAVMAYADYYGTKTVNPADILQPRVYASLQANAGSRCVGDLYAMYQKSPDAVFKPEFVGALRAGQLKAKYPGVARALDLNNAGLVKAGASIPAFVAQGTADDIVTTGAQRAFVRKQCAMGRPVTYREYGGINHYQTRQVAMRDAIAWMKSLSGGSLALSNCQ